MVLDRWEKVGKVLDGGGQGAAAEVQRRRGSPVRDWRQGEAGELRGPKVELARGSRGSEKVWSGGFTAASSSPVIGFIYVYVAQHHGCRDEVGAL